jgi:hypothetical protein
LVYDLPAIDSRLRDAEFDNGLTRYFKTEKSCHLELEIAQQIAAP